MRRCYARKGKPPNNDSRPARVSRRFVSAILQKAPGGKIGALLASLCKCAATSLGVISQTAASRPYSLAVVQPIPEPGTLLFGFALLGASLTRGRRNSAPRA